MIRTNRTMRIIILFLSFTLAMSQTKAAPLVASIYNLKNVSEDKNNPMVQNGYKNGFLLDISMTMQDLQKWYLKRLTQFVRSQNVFRYARL